MNHLASIEIVLVEPVYPGNVGAIARSAANYGVKTVKIVGNLDVSCDDARQMALYGYPLIQNAVHCKTLSEAVSSWTFVIGTVQQERYNRVPPASARITMNQYKDRLMNGTTALVFGREDNGLTRDEIDQCHVLSTIPTPTGLSFNLAHSVTVFLNEIYHAVKPHNPLIIPDKPSHGELENLLNLIQNSLFSIGFFRPEQNTNTMIRIRDIVYRMDLIASDIPVLEALCYKFLHFSKRAHPYLPADLFRDCRIVDCDEE